MKKNPGGVDKDGVLIRIGKKLKRRVTSKKLVLHTFILTVFLTFILTEMRVLVCGDRLWSDITAIAREVERIHFDTPINYIISGMAKGADTIAIAVAEELGIPVLKFPADWSKYGRAAGPVRNRQMLEEGKPDIVLAFHPDITKSKGTKDMVERSKKAGVKVFVFAA